MQIYDAYNGSNTHGRDVLAQLTALTALHDSLTPNTFSFQLRKQRPQMGGVVVSRSPCGLVTGSLPVLPHCAHYYPV